MGDRARLAGLAGDLGIEMDRVVVARERREGGDAIGVEPLAQRRRLTGRQPIEIGEWCQRCPPAPATIGAIRRLRITDVTPCGDDLRITAYPVEAN